MGKISKTDRLSLFEIENKLCWIIVDIACPTGNKVFDKEEKHSKGMIDLLVVDEILFISISDCRSSGSSE